MPPTQHSKLSPSSAKTWSRCTASIAYTDQCRENPATRASILRAEQGSIYADEGSTAHDYAEKILLGKMDPKKLPKDFKQVMDYVEVCKTLANRWEGTEFVEAKVPLFYYPQDTGTTDHAVVSKDMVTITDLKWGAGVPVDAEDNEQLAIYALSLVNHYQESLGITDSTPVEIRIVQPRYPGDETVKLWQLTVAELRDFCGVISAAAEVILNGPEEALDFAPDEASCRWCKAKQVCHARAEQTFTRMNPDVMAMFACEDEDEVELLTPVTSFPVLTQRQIVGIHQRADEIRQILDDCAKYLFERALEGSPVEGTKLVAGRQGNRAWSDEAEAAAKVGKLLGDEMYTKKIISPTQVAKLLKEGNVPKEVIAEVDKLVVRANGKPVIALSTDKRPAIAPPTDSFTADDDDQTPQ